MPIWKPGCFAARDAEKDTLRSKAFIQNPAEPWTVTLNSLIWAEAK